MTARRNHYVSQCYLRGFAVTRKRGKPQVLVYDREQCKVFTSAIDNIAVEKDFNRVDLDGVPPDALETGLASFEGVLAPALERTIASAAFSSDDDRAYVLNFVGLLALRNPRWRERMRQVREQTAKMIMDITLSSKERYERQTEAARRDGFLNGVADVSYEEMKQFQNEGFRLEVSTDVHIRQEMKGLDTILPFLFNRKWLFLKAPKGSPGFITSDHPVTLTWADPAQRGRAYPPGFGLPETDVMFPLSNQLAMLGAFEIDSGTIELTEDRVAGFNGAEVATAIRQVYARDHNFRYSLDPREAPRKASRLIDDPQFLRSSLTRPRESSRTKMMVSSRVARRGFTSALSQNRT